MDPLAPALDLIKHWEGCVLHAYQDSVGVWTIGYGTTKGAKPGMVISKEKAVQLLMIDVAACSAAVAKYVKVQITNHEMCALISLSYNIGTGALSKSTLVKKLNAGRPRVEVADEFLRWVHAGGRVLQGLVNRRKAERLVFLTHDVVEVTALV